jgi:hypothetical protein
LQNAYPECIMESLTIVASIKGIIEAAGKVAGILREIKAPKSVRDLHAEVDCFKLIFTSLQRFLIPTSNLPVQRAALVQLEDLVVILTQTVHVFSDLESLLLPLDTQQAGDWLIVEQSKWTVEETAATRLANRLQILKSSLKLLLQIFQW